MKQTILSAACALILVGCRPGTDHPTSATPPDISQPVIQYWDGGIGMIGKPPFVLFAAWSDGRVVKRVGEITMEGTVSPQTILEALASVRKGGFFTPSTSALLNTYGMVFPDGPVRCLAIVDGDKHRTLFYHGRDDLNRLDQIAPGASPSREQSEEFIAMWKRVVAEIERMTPTNLVPFRGERRLMYPRYPAS